MNIKRAKNEIKNTITAYFTKDKFGNYAIPIEKQRPIFLMGAPGIGKTAIMEQIASEMNIPLVAYSMTHHTRQSALGLPFITEKNFDGEIHKVSEYTMSEIVATVYEMIEKTGSKEGILFLDEINCVSETLAPIMLQFLQYKVFGKHKVPDGFVVITAGNPPEYNNSVREFDIVTWDRLKRIDVSPELDIWREYAINSDVHSSIISYLDIKKEDFYSVSSTVDGKNFVTARGWEDLSQMINLYEKHDFDIDKHVVKQYLQDDKIAKSYANYYSLYVKYKAQYDIKNILDGVVSNDVKDKAKKSEFDERISVISLLVGEICGRMRNTIEMLDACRGAFKELQNFEKDYKNVADFQEFIKTKKESIQKQITGGSYTKKKQLLDNNIFEIFNQLDTSLDDIDVFYKNSEKLIKLKASDEKTNAESISENLVNIFKFIEEVYNDEQEMLILITELTANIYSSKFIGKFGSQEYFAHNKELLLTDRANEISNEIAKLSKELDI